MPTRQLKCASHLFVTLLVLGIKKQEKKEEEIQSQQYNNHKSSINFMQS